MWTQTTNEGRRILQTQNGGKSYGYTITGDLNTAEYELLVENGQDGKDGKGYEWIFKHTTENITPSTPATSQVDDYVPSGWHMIRLVSARACHTSGLAAARKRTVYGVRFHRQPSGPSGALTVSRPL